MKRTIAVALMTTCVLCCTSGDPLVVDYADLIQSAQKSLDKGVTFFHSISTEGGYVYHVTPDLARRWGENPADEHTIEVQPPGTPAVGMSFLRAYTTTGNKAALIAAKDAAKALIKGQNQLGGWEHTIRFNKPLGDKVSFDDNQTQSAISFLMAMDQVVDDPQLTRGVGKALSLMMESQLENGGWPHVYPTQGNYHDYATFNDGGINDCIRVMKEAFAFYGRTDIEKSLRKAARFICISQLPPPQPGWAQQYNEYMQPAWARTFEPSSVCPSVSIKNINTLIDLYVALGSSIYLEPIPDALRWLEECRMENGKWARFVEIGTGNALYYDRDRIRVDTLEELHPERRTGYGYETDLNKPMQAAKERYRKAMELTREDFREHENPDYSQAAAMKRMESLSDVVRGIIASQEASGAWITYDDRFKRKMPKDVRWNGQYEETDRISSAVFNRNVKTLCDFLDLSRIININMHHE